MKTMHPKTTNVSTLQITDLVPAGAEEISAALRELLADVFALYVKTKNFHWHMNGRHFRDFHLMLDDQSDQLFAMIDPVAERTRKLGGTSLHSIGDIARNQRLPDNDVPDLAAEAMLKELLLNNQELTKYCAPPTKSATGTTTSPPPAFSRTGSTKPSNGPGSSTRSSQNESQPRKQAGSRER